VLFRSSGFKALNRRSGSYRTLGTRNLAAAAIEAAMANTVEHHPSDRMTKFLRGSFCSGIGFMVREVIRGGLTSDCSDTKPARLINAPLQRGDLALGYLQNRFSGFFRVPETAKEVSIRSRQLHPAEAGC